MAHQRSLLKGVSKDTAVVDCVACCFQKMGVLLVLGMHALELLREDPFIGRLQGSAQVPASAKKKRPPRHNAINI